MSEHKFYILLKNKFTIQLLLSHLKKKSLEIKVRYKLSNFKKFLAGFRVDKKSLKYEI